MLATRGAHAVRDALDLQIRPDKEQKVRRLIMLGAVAYIGLLVFPFVPGAEIGLAMLAAFGPAIAPLIHICTVTAMVLAYVVGRFLPVRVLRRVLRTMRMRRAAELVARATAERASERGSEGDGAPFPENRAEIVDDTPLPGC